MFLELKLVSDMIALQRLLETILYSKLFYSKFYTGIFNRNFLLEIFVIKILYSKF